MTRQRCTRCKELKEIKYKARLNSLKKKEYNVRLCDSCLMGMIPSIIGHLEGKDYDHFLEWNGQLIERKENAN
jgi:hypothetical protein